MARSEQTVTSFHFREFLEYEGAEEDGTLAALETTGASQIPINVFAEKNTDFDLHEGEMCYCEVVGVGSGIKVFENEDAYYASDMKMASVAVIPTGTFSPTGAPHFQQSPDIRFSGKVIDVDTDPEAEPDGPNYCITVETLEMTVIVFLRYEGKIETGYFVNGTAWLYGHVCRHSADARKWSCKVDVREESER